MSADHAPPPRSRAHSAMALPSFESATRSPQRAERTPSDQSRTRFVALSVILTGFDDAELWGTGMVDPYLGWLLSVVGDQFTGDLLSASQYAIDAAKGDEAKLEQLVRDNILADPTLGPIARNLIVLWYLGEWNQLPADWRDAHGASAMDQTCIISPDAYAQGLVWKAIHTHPTGAKMPGYASWSLPPYGVEGEP